MCPEAGQASEPGSQEKRHVWQQVCAHKAALWQPESPTPETCSQSPHPGNLWPGPGSLLSCSFLQPGRRAELYLLI